MECVASTVLLPVALIAPDSKLLSCELKEKRLKPAVAFNLDVMLYESSPKIAF